MAITEYYVTDAGAGSGNGSSEANAMSFATFVDYMVTGGTYTAAAGDRFNIKGAITSRTTTTDTFVNGGTSTSPVIIRGYGTTIGDGAQGRTGGNGALVTTNMPTIPYSTGQMLITGSWIILESLKITGNGNNSVLRFATGTESVAYNCAVSQSATNTAGSAIELSSRTSLINCDATTTNGGNAGRAGIYLNNPTGGRCMFNRINSTAIGIINAAAAVYLIGNTIYGCGGIGISCAATAGYSVMVGNTIVGCGGDGIDVVTGSTSRHDIINNMITDNGGYGIDGVSAANGFVLANNRLRDNSGGSINSATDWVAATSWNQSAIDTGATGTTATDYVDYAANNFNLVTGASPSPAVGAALIPYNSCGALQPVQPAATGGGGGSFTFIG